MRHVATLILRVCGLLLCMVALPTAHAQEPVTASGKVLYERLLEVATAQDPGPAKQTFARLETASHELDWQNADTGSFQGHIRVLRTESGEALHLVRDLGGSVYVLALPEDAAMLAAGSGSPYAGVQDMVKHKLQFDVRIAGAEVGGEHYDFVQLQAQPERLLLDRLFFIAIVLLLFLVMVGMGLTLTVKDFAVIALKPKGMLVGVVLQFGLLPLLAMALGRAAGFYDAYPFIFLGLILVAASPGGVTSNLMTYLGRGDVALSVSLTAVCTLLAIVFTPLMLTLYGSNIPDFSIPVMEVVKTMMVLVVIPLFVGMGIRSKWEAFALKAEKPFAILGIFALLFLIVTGIWSNLATFADTDRYGVAFYSVIFVLTLSGMLSAALISKLLRIANFQVRAISLEVGLRNASLSMTIALLLQDRMGDFASSMFFTSGIFGLAMYVAGAITIFAFPKVLPVKEEAKGRGSSPEPRAAAR